MYKLSIIIPVYCEEQIINECYERLLKVLSPLDNYSHELIFVDDGSYDNTLNVLKELASQNNCIKIISFARNFGHQCAVTAGLKASKGDVVAIIDADLQDPPECIPEMLKLWEKGYEVVYAKRISREGETFFKLITAKFFYKLLQSVTKINIPRDTGDFRLIDRKVVNVINNLPEHNKFLRGLFPWIGFKQIAYEYQRQPRYAGITKYSLNKMFKFALDGIIGFSDFLLKLIGIFGIVSLLFSFLLFSLSIILYFSENKVLDFKLMTIIIIAFFSLGLQMLSLWITSEYISRIYDECKNRPQYVISKLINIDKVVD